MTEMYRSTGIEILMKYKAFINKKWATFICSKLVLTSQHSEIQILMCLMVTVPDTVQRTD